MEMEQGVGRLRFLYPHRRLVTRGAQNNDTQRWLFDRV